MTKQTEYTAPPNANANINDLPHPSSSTPSPWMVKQTGDRVHIEPSGYTTVTTPT